MKKKLKRICFLFIVEILIFPFTIYAGPGDPVKLGSPIKATSLSALVADILDVVITIAIPIAILAIIYSGFLFVKARGNPAKLTEAKTTLLYTIIGIAVLLGAELLSKIVEGTISNLVI